MKKSVIICLALFILFLFNFQSATAVNTINKTGATLAVTKIQKSIIKLTSDLRKLNENSSVGKSSLTVSYEQLLLPITDKYLRDKSISTSRVSTLLADLNLKSNFVILGEHYEGCDGRCIVGSVVNLPYNSKYEDVQSWFDRSVLLGNITPLDNVAYNKARDDYKTALQELVEVDSIYKNADLELKEKVFAGYNLEDKRLKNDLKIQKLALIAAKRSLLSPRDFEQNFKTAFYFQYNLDSLNLVESSVFSDKASFPKALNIISVSQAYELGIEISRKYEKSRAMTFNKSLSGLSTSNSDFQLIYQKAFEIFKSSSRR